MGHSMTRWGRLTIFALLFLIGSRTAIADPAPVRLTTATRMEPGGEGEDVAFHFAIAPGWHIYWLNPGQTGLPTQIAWTLPNHVQAGPIAWPVPEQFQSGTLINYGYARAVTLTAPLRGVAARSETFAHAQVTWLACAQMCVPESATIAIALGHASGELSLFNRNNVTLPKDLPGSTYFRTSSGTLQLVVNSPIIKGASPGSVSFFPHSTHGVNALSPRVRIRAERLTLVFRQNPNSRKPGQFAGVLRLAGRGAWNIVARSAPIDVSAKPNSFDLGLWSVIGFAFVGGLILNLMPCVLPILSMKALSFVAAHERPSELRAEGLLYFAGVMTCFMAIAATLLFLRAAGHLVGWGFQLQSPIVVAFLALLCIAIGFNFLGFLELPSAIAGVGGTVLQRGSAAWRAFFTGVLAVVVASPCTAPFMGAAMGFALTQPYVIAFLVFLALALGFAAPFTALTFLPRLVQLLPRPGTWMIVLKEALAFPMFGTAIWLLWVLGLQAGAGGIALVLGCATSLLFLWWLNRHVQQRWSHTASALAGGGLLALLVYIMPSATAHMGAHDNRLWQPWSPQAVARARAEGHPVFVDFGAAWCVTCLVNEQLALNAPSVRSAFRRDGMVTLKGDWTNRNSKIASLLKSYGRAGVPLYLVYPANPRMPPVLLPQLLTPSLVLSKLRSVLG